MLKMLSNWDLSDLASHLRQERLFVSSEQQSLQNLNERVKEISKSLAQLAWISSYQRINLNNLILAKIDCLPALTCQRNYTIENVIFVDACKVLGYPETFAFGEFLTILRNNVELIARCLTVSDKLFPDSVPEIVYSLSAGLYGSCLLPEDKTAVLKLLQQLTALQLVPSDNPRRLLRHGSCAFARLYSIFHENLYSAKLFLTAALHGPIMKLLKEDEMFLDIDPDKAGIRLSLEERYEKFGPEDNPNYGARVQRHRMYIVYQLVQLTQYFIFSLEENMHCFPTSVYWLVRQMAGLFSKSGFLGEKEIYEICTELVFTYFICPAIVNPEPYGITDVPIGYIARFNLMQVAQILQMLAMRKYEDVDPKVADLYNEFPIGCVSRFIDRILEDSTNCLEEQPPREDHTGIEGLTRSAALFTHSQLNNLVKFFQNLLRSDNDLIDKTQLESLLSKLPPVCANGYKSTISKTSTEKPITSNLDSSILRKSSVLLSKVNKQKNYSLGSGGISNLLGTNENMEETKEEELPEQILVLPLSGCESEPVGLLSEQKVIELEEKRQVDVIPIGVEGEQDLGEARVERHGAGQEKRTRFSLSHDEGSIGNTSDNLEAVSEAASNHSGASSLESENEDQNDNLSDMVSANVSGRGTPNISGRDTPSSQITEGDEGRVGEEEIRGNPNEHRQVVTAVSKQTRSDIDDKFGKFEIKKQEVLGDETTSLVSDTWSTDVLASDSETVEQCERNFPRPPDTDGPPHPFIQHSLDISETASEAWSTDVLTSDSERLTEVDTDDTASVARSDDTAHSEFGIRGEADGRETPPPHSSTLFRPIKESSNGRISLVVPPSPTRGDKWNATGRGSMKSDPRRRTLEFLDAASGRNFTKLSTNNQESSRMIHVIDKIEPPKTSSQPPTSVRTSRSGSVPRSRSPQPSQSQPLPNGTENPLLESNVVPNDHAQKLSLENCNLSVAEPEMAALTLSDRNSDGNEEAAGLFDDSDITPPSPILSNLFPPPSLLPSNSLFLNNHKPPTSYSSSYKYNDIKFKQEVRGFKEGEESDRVFFSSPSLASTSSSGSNSGQPSQLQPVVEAPVVSRSIEKVNASTGAIPKSISFDKTAERGDKEYMDEDQKQRKGFFRNLKMSFKNRKIKHFRGEDLGRFDENMPGTSSESFCSTRKNDNTEESRNQNGDVIEDILAKYRNKPPAETGEVVPNDLIEKKSIETDEDEGLSDESIFLNAKRKLRLVLCNSDLHISSPGSVASDVPLVSFLKLQLAEAVNLQNRSLVSQLQETLRCVSLFDDESCRRLFKSLKEDYQNRAPYIAYLIRSRQTLLSSIARLERMTERIESDSRVCRKFLVALCVRMFLEKKEDTCLAFSKEFQQLTLADEKMDLLDKFLTELSHQLEKDPNWAGASDSQLEQAKSIIETAIISQVYPYALYPNGNVDAFRDFVLHEHMQNLASVITLNHKALQIPKIFAIECPWPSAQAEISALAAYKTPKDKVSCICRCATTIMNLLSMAVDGNVPSADDFVPVLVFVLIMANPPALLSTVQYVNSFYGSRLEGEEQYWWTQFSSAIEFIKTMVN